MAIRRPQIRNTIEVQWQITSNGKHHVTPGMEGEGKGDGHQHGRKPRTPEPIPIAGNSASEEAMGHWTPTGIEPMDYDDDDIGQAPRYLRDLIRLPSSAISLRSLRSLDCHDLC